MNLLVDNHKGAAGSALVIVMVLGAISLLLLASTMHWVASNAKVVDSSIRHSVAVAAAEAATEKVVSPACDGLF